LRPKSQPRGGLHTEKEEITETFTVSRRGTANRTDLFLYLIVC